METYAHDTKPRLSSQEQECRSQTPKFKCNSIRSAVEFPNIIRTSSNAFRSDSRMHVKPLCIQVKSLSFPIYICEILLDLHLILNGWTPVFQNTFQKLSRFQYIDFFSWSLVHSISKIVVCSLLQKNSEAAALWASKMSPHNDSVFFLQYSYCACCFYCFQVASSQETQSHVFDAAPVELLLPLL